MKLKNIINKFTFDANQYQAGWDKRYKVSKIINLNKNIMFVKNNEIISGSELVAFYSKKDNCFYTDKSQRKGNDEYSISLSNDKNRAIFSKKRK